MTRLISLSILLLFLSHGTHAQFKETVLADTAKIFVPGVVSSGNFEFNASFTPDEKTVYFSRSTSDFGLITLFTSSFVI